MGGRRQSTLRSQDLDYFENQLVVSTPEFWSRFGRRPAVAGAKVLDLGCGHGAMSIDLARRGATVLGIDIEPGLVDFARENLRQRFPDLSARVRFVVGDLAGVEDEDFDLVVSKDTFEHIVDLPGVLGEISRLLRPGGELWAGFSPLYFSPRGDHLRSGLRVPWAHAVLPRRLVLRAASRHNGRPVRGLADIGLNGMTPADFRALFEASDLELAAIAYNRGDKARLRILGRLRRIRGLERFATVSIYAVLVKPARSGSDPARHPA